ncbi:hypothetical protein KDA00_04055 [Candidatus Saccharibacteria bacterium]|nr:hypothetical protein [Candidatus Saccharibacteria bacterium]
MNFEVKDIPKKITPIIEKYKKYNVIAFIVCVAIVFGFLVFKINQYTQIEPSEDAIAEELNTVTRPKIDEKAIEKIQQLEDQNIEVKSLFEQARDNPFSE